jgi:hypothetical protein
VARQQKSDVLLADASDVSQCSDDDKYLMEFPHVILYYHPMTGHRMIPFSASLFRVVDEIERCCARDPNSRQEMDRRLRDCHGNEGTTGKSWVCSRVLYCCV